MRAILFYLVQMVLPALLGALLWALTLPLRRRALSKHHLRAGPNREKVLLLCFMFVAGLLALTLAPVGFWYDLLILRRLPAPPQPFQGGVNLVPVRQSWALLRHYARAGDWEAILVNFPGNVVMFLPVGLFAGLLSDKPRWWKGTLWALGLSLFIEIFQLLVSRGTDVDDLILNALGGLLGHGAFLLLRRADPGLVRRCAKL